MIVHFNVSDGARHGRIEKEVREGPLDGLNVMLTVDEARALWEKPGTITDCNLAFRRLATEFDFDIPACLKWYRADAAREQALLDGDAPMERVSLNRPDAEAIERHASRGTLADSQDAREFYEREADGMPEPGDPNYDAALQDPEANR